MLSVSCSTALWNVHSRRKHKICAYILRSTANEFNHFYHETKILSEQDEARKASYLALLDLVREARDLHRPAGILGTGDGCKIRQEEK